MSSGNIQGVEIEKFIVRDDSGVELVVLERETPGVFFGVVHTSGRATSWDVFDCAGNVLREPIGRDWNTTLLVKDYEVRWSIRAVDPGELSFRVIIPGMTDETEKPKRKHETLSGLSPEVEARACTVVEEGLRLAVQAATYQLHARLGLTIGASLIVVARVVFTTIGTGFFAATKRVDLREDVEGMVSAIWKASFAEARDAVRQVDDRKVDEEIAAKKGAN